MSAPSQTGAPLRIAVIGSGIAGMAAAWLLSSRHQVTVYEKQDRVGGHSNTVTVPVENGEIAVDTGFIVYNDLNYPNLVALFEHLGVPTRASDMSFAVSLDDGALEYAGTNLATLFAQRRNLLRPRFWAMLRDVARFYREAPVLLERDEAESPTLGAYLAARGYSRAFVVDHLLPMAAAIWSAPPAAMQDHPATAFIRFCQNHGLLRLKGRPQWRTVVGGSREYVRRLTARYADRIRLSHGAHRILRIADGVLVADRDGRFERFDHAVIATHADEALTLLDDTSPAERRILGAFPYQPNVAVLHTDARLMPRRRKVWSSWNYLGRGSEGDRLCVTYWMNRLQSLPTKTPLLVTLNPAEPPRLETVIQSILYDHPIFNLAAMHAQGELWQLQGCRRTWFCGAYFGAGFHEDGLQAGLWVAETLGGVRRPWNVAEESGRLRLPSLMPDGDALERAS